MFSASMNSAKVRIEVDLAIRLIDTGIVLLYSGSTKDDTMSSDVGDIEIGFLKVTLNTHGNRGGFQCDGA
jgi:hypothetical protein